MQSEHSWLCPDTSSLVKNSDSIMLSHHLLVSSFCPIHFYPDSFAVLRISCIQLSTATLVDKIQRKFRLSLSKLLNLRTILVHYDFEFGQNFYIDCQQMI